MEFSRHEHWSGLSFPTPGDFPDAVIKSMSLASPALAGGFLTTSATWKAQPINFKNLSIHLISLSPHRLCINSMSMIIILILSSLLQEKAL